MNKIILMLTWENARYCDEHDNHDKDMLFISASKFFVNYSYKNIRNFTVCIYLCGARCGDPGGEEAGESAGVAGAEAALRREYSVPPTAMAVPPPTGSVTRVTLNPDVERVGRDGAVSRD